MNGFKYTPDEDLKVHEEGAIRLICAAFRSHGNGLPEWLKNSADAYAREDAPASKRVIVVIFDHGRKSAKPSISCLDFSGMTSKMIEEDFRHWADPEAACRGAKNISRVQGGHGNGGKCYMTQMFDEYSLIHTIKDGKGNRYGVRGGAIRFGYIPNKEEGCDFLVENLQEDLTKVLQSIRCNLDTLPPEASEALKIADGYTLVQGIGPKECKNRIPVSSLISALQEHPQMIQTLEFCKVFIIENGRIHNNGKQLTLPKIAPMEGEEEPRVIPIPENLKDPQTEEEVSTTHDNSLPCGRLILRTSQVSMRYKSKGRHNIIYKALSGFIGYNSILELDIQSSYRTKIYGECELESLEPFKQNDRHYLASSPLTRAVRKFISDQIQKYALEFEARDRRKYDQKEKNAISKMNEALDRWKNRFLKDLMQGLWGSEGENAPLLSKTPLPSGKPARIELTLSHQFAGVGVSFRPTLKFFDSEGKQIRPVPFHWYSEDTNIAWVDEDLMVINTFSYGKTFIYAETLDNKIHSNKVPLEVVRIHEIHISPPQIEMPVGSRQKFNALCHLANGESTNDIYLLWEEGNPNVAKVSASGLVYGFAIGETTVVAMDDKCMAQEAAVKVTPDKGKGSGDKHGRGYPKILVSDIDVDPDTKKPVVFSSEEPPVLQRPEDVERNIWWINSSAPLAKLYLDTNKGYGYESREWRMYHLERYIEIIVQIALTHGPTEVEMLSVNDWIMKWGEQVAEIQSAAVSDLTEFIAHGELPEES